MTKTVQKVAVLGAGVMGSGIAALLAGVGMKVMLLDVMPTEPDELEKSKGITISNQTFRNKIAQAGLDRIMNPKSGMLFQPEMANLITIGNFADNMELIADCDWIIEVVVERLDIKKKIMQQIETFRKRGSIVSTNTSGVSINQISKDMPEEFRQHFLGTHFFNPPRYMRLFEIIATKDTLPEVTKYIEHLAQNVLGKGVVYAKDTPNFIGNRIGVFSSVQTLKLMECYDFDVPTVDQLTGPVIGRPKSASFRTSDMVGLDILVGVAGNVVNNVSDPQEKALFILPDFIFDMVKSGALGDKTKHGFYTRTPKKEILYWNLKTKEYSSFVPNVPEAVQIALKSKNKYETMVYGESKENKFCWDLIKSLLLYSASKVPEISEDFKMIDKAMVWGYNWEKGPFEVWDAIGTERSIKRMKQEGENIPAWVEVLLKDNGGCFYNSSEESSPYIKLKEATNVISSNEDASLRDIGDGVLCLEFHSKGNSISDKSIDILQKGIYELNNDWVGLVIGNRGKNFSAGANLAGITGLIENKQWDLLAENIKGLQSVNMALKYAPKPVVAAPFNMAVGGGAEIVLHTHSVVPYVDTYMGLVEVGVGLIPAGGGCKEYLLRSYELAGGNTRQALVPALQKAWRSIATGSVSSNAFDAVNKGIMRKNSRVVMNIDALIDQAKKEVLELAGKNYTVPAPSKIMLLGDYGRAVLIAELEMMISGRFASEYDAHIGKKIAFILTGGNAMTGTIVDEQYILDLELEAFVSLCGEEKTQQRIANMLTKGKILRN